MFSKGCYGWIDKMKRRTSETSQKSHSSLARKTKKTCIILYSIYFNNTTTTNMQQIYNLTTNFRNEKQSYNINYIISLKLKTKK